MKISKSERIKKIIQTDDKNLFYTKPNIPLDYPSTQIMNNNNNNESLQKKTNEQQQNIQKQPSIEFKIGNYLILQTIGEGTFGKVKLGIYLKNNEKVAIKILEKDRIRDNDDHIRIKRELIIRM